MVLRFDGPDGKELESVTITCDDEGAAWVIEALSEQMEVPPELAAEGYEMMKGSTVRTIQFASSTPIDPPDFAKPS